MQLEFESCYRALRARDPRFDGRFFVGVASTLVYCRPVCRVRAPTRENCRFFPSAAAAEAAGYRPCLRCRPELAPGLAALDADARLVQAAVDLIESDLGNEQGVAAVAARLGVTARHLRRAFQARLAASPVQFAQTQRLLLAKLLLTDTSMSVTDVALASGFGSLRRCDALFRSRYRLTPAAVRGDAGAHESRDALAFQLGFRPPLDWTAVLSFLERRAIVGVEQVDGSVYRRTAQVQHAGGLARGWVMVGLARCAAHLEVRVSASLVGSLPPVFTRIKRQFDIGCDPEEVSSALGVLAAGRPGLRVPGAFDGFETAVRAILGQQVTVKAARTLAGRFAAAFGEPCATPFDGLNRLFPDPDRVAALQVPDIAALGVVSARANAIRSLAGAMASGALRLDPGVEPEATLEKLRRLPGVGEWTAQYVAMRALAWPDAFPHSDHGVLKALGETDPRKALQRAAAWRPWRAYAVMHLWRSLEG